MFFQVFGASSPPQEGEYRPSRTIRVSLGHLGPVLDGLGAVFGLLGAVVRILGVLGPSWGRLELSPAALRAL